MSWQRSILIAAILLFAAVYYGLAFVALQDLFRRPSVRGENKTAWALAILCLPILGATLYGYLGATSAGGRAFREPEPEFTPFDHLFEDDDFSEGQQPMTTALFRSPEFARHDELSHVENQRRLQAIDAALEQRGLLIGRPAPVFQQATIEQLSRVHELGYIEALERAAAEGGGWIDNDTYLGPDSVAVAALASGAATAAVDAALQGASKKNFVIARPPGHHARPMIGMGFCLFDTIAVGAAQALSQGIKRIAIVDWDVHHGNGTQEIFYESDQVFFSSIHQWPLYPGTGAAREIGAGRGEGYTVNVPLSAGAGNADYLKALDELILPRLRAFEPELVMVSAGYDCHRDDPLGSMRVDEDGFGAMTERLLDLAETTANGRIVLVLEGGYDPAALARSVVRTIEVLDGAMCAQRDVDPFHTQSATQMTDFGPLPPQGGMSPYRQEDERKRELARLSTLQNQIDELRTALRELASRQVRLEEGVKQMEGGSAENRILIEQSRQESQVSARARAIDENRTRQQIVDMDQRLEDAVRPVRSLQAHVSELLEASRRKTDDTGAYNRRFEEIRAALEHQQAVGDRNTIAAHQLRETIESSKNELDLVRRDFLRNDDAVKIVDQEMRRRIAEVAQASEGFNARLDDIRADVSHGLDLISDLQRASASVEPSFEELRKADADSKTEAARINQQALERHETIVDRIDDLRQATDAQFADVRTSQDQRFERLGERIDEVNEQYRELGVRIAAFVHQLDELRLVDESLRRDLWQLHEQRVRLRLEQAQQELDQLSGARRDSEEAARRPVVALPRPADR